MILLTTGKNRQLLATGISGHLPRPVAITILLWLMVKLRDGRVHIDTLLSLTWQWLDHRFNWLNLHKSPLLLKLLLMIEHLIQWNITPTLPSSLFFYNRQILLFTSLRPHLSMQRPQYDSFFESLHQIVKVNLKCELRPQYSFTELVEHL